MSYEIAVIGSAGIFPGAKDIFEYQDILKQSKVTVSRLEKSQLSPAESLLYDTPNYIPYYGYINDPTKFDYEYFNLALRDAKIISPQQRKFLELAYYALQDAAYLSPNLPDRTSIFAGSSSDDYLYYLLTNFPEFKEKYSELELIIANSKDQLAMRVAYHFNLKGSAVTVQTACSTSLVAVHLACQSLLTRESDMALAGAISIPYFEPKGYLYKEGMNQSRDGNIRAFDKNASGMVSGCGGGIVVLKRLDDAIADDDKIDAIIVSSATNNDGHNKSSYTAPSLLSQQKVIMEAIELAEINVEDLAFVEAHGSGTLIGDPIEFMALTRALQSFSSQKSYCALSSVKSNIGHLDAAAGIAGLIKAILQLKNRIIYPITNFDEENSNIDVNNSPFYFNKTQKEIATTASLAGITSLGIGGTNCHLILASSPRPQKIYNTKPAYVLIKLIATNQPIMKQYCQKIINYLGENPQELIENIAKTLHTRYYKNDNHFYLSFKVLNTLDLKQQLNDYVLNGSINQTVSDDNYETTEIAGAKISLPLQPLAALDIPLTKDNVGSENKSEYILSDYNEVSRIWKNVLDLTHLKTTDNYRDIGGHSIITLDLIDQINEKFNLKLPYYWIETYDTIDKQVREIQTLRNDAFDPIVLSNGDLTDIESPVLIIFHASISNSDVYRSLISHLNKKINVICIDSYNFNHPDKLITNLDDLCEYYYQKIYPHIINHKSVYLAGWSLGGIIALNTAEKFHADNINVENIFLFDSIRYCEKSRIFFESDNFLFFRRELSDTSLKTILNTKILNRLLLLNDLETEMCKTFAPTPYNYPTTLFISENPIVESKKLDSNLAGQFSELKLDNGWANILRKNNSIFLDANHDDILKDKNCQILACHINQTIVSSVIVNSSIEE